MRSTLRKARKSRMRTLLRNMEDYQKKQHKRMKNDFLVSRPEVGERKAGGHLFIYFFIICL